MAPKILSAAIWSRKTTRLLAGAKMISCWRGVIMNPLLERITINPNVCFGKPCMRGTHIWVSLILDLLASVATEEKILKEYSQLKTEDLRAAIAYGAEMSRERYVE